MDILKRTWAEIDLDNLEHNYRQLRSRTPDSCLFLAMVKADGYGHGAVAVARHLTGLGAEMVSVSNLEEAVALRKAGIGAPVLILGYTPPEWAEALCRYELIQEIHSLEYARRLDERLKGTDFRLAAHIKLDTGMSRLGFYCGGNGQGLDEAAEAAGLNRIGIEGVFTHFATADVKNDVCTAAQYELFNQSLTELEARGVSFKIRHCSNSAAVINYPQYHMDMIRPGIAAYGLYPAEDQRQDIDLLPVMSLRSVISQIKVLDAGTGVSYGRTAVLDGKRTVAVVAAGYADGLPRVLSNNLEMVVRGQRVRQIGRICMDMCMIDVSDVPGAESGDIVTLIGSDSGETLPMNIWADKTDTITYEIACGISKRVARIFYKNQIPIDTLRYIV